MERSKGDWRWTRAAIVAVCLWMLGLPCGGRFDGSAGEGEPASSVPLWVNPTPQRMCVGMVRGGKVIAQELKQVADPQTNRECDVFDWFEGDLASGAISAFWLYSDHEAGRTRLIRAQHGLGLRRWRWAPPAFEDGRFLHVATPFRPEKKVKEKKTVRYRLF